MGVISRVVRGVFRGMRSVRGVRGRDIGTNAAAIGVVVLGVIGGINVISGMRNEKVNAGFSDIGRQPVQIQSYIVSGDRERDICEIDVIPEGMRIEVSVISQRVIFCRENVGKRVKSWIHKDSGGRFISERFVVMEEPNQIYIEGEIKGMPGWYQDNFGRPFSCDEIIQDRPSFNLPSDLPIDNSICNLQLPPNTSQ